MPERRTGISRADLIAAASQKIQDDRRTVGSDQRHEATVLLADLYATGLRHGITAEHWALVASLGTEAIDVIRARDRDVGVAPYGLDVPPVSFVPEPGVRDRGRYR